MKRKMMVIGIFTLVFSSLGCEKLIAQEQADGQWTTYTTSDGLPYNEVGAVAFGPDGDLWCAFVHPGGDGGIAHFDENTWEHLTNEDGLGSNFIIWFEHTLAVSSDNILWIATFGGGVSRFDGEGWTTYTSADGLHSDNVTAVAIAPDGDLWCTHSDCGISHFDGRTWTVTTPNDLGVTSCHLIDIAIGPDSTLWSIGSHVFSFNDESWTDFSTQTGMEMAFYMDTGPDGRLWIGGEEGGVSCYDGSEWKHYSLADMGAKGSGGVMPMAVDSENVLWVGVYEENEEIGEVFRFDGKSWTKFAPEGGPALKSVYSITVGPDSTIWFGTDYGLFGYNEKSPSTKVPNNNEEILAVYPNPFTDRITIKGYRDMEVCISVFDIMGHILFEESCKGKNEFHINTTNLPKGIYFVQIASIDNTTAYKIIK